MTLLIDKVYEPDSFEDSDKTLISEIENPEFAWIDDEVVGIVKCPICHAHEEYNAFTVNIYYNWKNGRNQCPNCHRKFVIEQITKLYTTIE